jgi:hypothetical protein
MTKAVGPANLHHVAPVERPAVRTTKADANGGFARHLQEILGARVTHTAAAKAAKMPTPSTPSDGQRGEGDAAGGSTDPQTSAGGTETHASKASSAATPGTETSSSTASPTHGKDGAPDGQMREVTGSMTLTGLLATGHPLRPAEAGTNGKESSHTDGSAQGTHLQSSASSTDAHAPLNHPSTAPERPAPQHRDLPDAAGQSSQSSGNEAHSTGDRVELPADVTLLELEREATSTDPSQAPTHGASTTAPQPGTDAFIAAAAASLSSGTRPDGGAGTSPSLLATPSSPVPGPNVTNALAADAIATARPDRITLQLPSDQGSVRIQVAISNGTVAARILMPDPAEAARLSTASGELRDALTRQGFDNVRIAVPAPAAAGVLSQGSAESSSNRTPDRTPQHSFTPASDRETSGRSQQRARRQRER